jgi:proteasome accessory factor A
LLRPRLLGVETEYPLAARGPDGTPVETEVAVAQLMQLARRRLPHLRDLHSGGGVFLENSMRLYVDTGFHPELCTPECTDPRDAVRYILAGEAILSRMATELAVTAPGISEATLFKACLDYHTGRSTWGCHESYAHHADPQVLGDQILPHLVSRLIYTGAGGFNTLGRAFEFVLSPRVPHLTNAVSDSSTHDRGIYHTKNEPLACEGYNRLHILCGESLCSEVAMYMKLGTTALVVAMIEAGLRPADKVRLRSPLAAMRRFARDETCQCAARGANGKTLTAIAIQRHYHELAASYAAELAPWAAEVTEGWGALLDRLQGAPSSVANVLDWAIKLHLYRERTQRNGRRWEGLKPPRELRAELCEIDARFGQLGEPGIFIVMDRAGVLDHHVPGIDRVNEAIRHPPLGGRAHLRGDCVKRFAGHGDRYLADWFGVVDTVRGEYLDLSDPFETRERWLNIGSPGCSTGSRGLRRLIEALSLWRAAPSRSGRYRDFPF